ncbi:ABC transporter substrate-binding protein [Kribbella sancticallisti]|uniref:ABC transporter substrate-binding protein n=1 Tax=Kribbella sancticallisti TaxID=460087 RepID=A0ABP4NKM3_9ACTN
MTRSRATLRAAPSRVAIAIIALLATAGCSESSGSSKPPDTQITVAAIAPIKTLDVAQIEVERSIASLVTEPLERTKSDGTFTPRLATSVSVAPKKLVYDLEPSAKFSNGKPVTPEDVAFSIKRLTNPKTAPVAASLLVAVKDVAATGPHQVTVTSDGSDPSLRNNIAFAVRVVEKANVGANPKDFGSASAPPIGSGPYVVSKFSTDEVVLDKNSTYWGEAPAFKTIKSTFVPDDNTARLAMRSGDLDVKFLRDVGTARQWESVPGASLAALPTTSIDYLTFDVAAPPFDDVHVRRAFAHAVDRKGLIDIVYGGRARPLTGMLTPEELSSISSPMEAEEILSGLPTYDYDLAAAKAELARSKYPNGFSIKVNVGSNIAYGEKTMLILQENLKPLGIDIEINPVSEEEWTAPLIAHKDLGMQTFSYGPLIADPARILSLMVSSAEAVPSGQNIANFTSKQLDSDVATLTGGPDKAQRLAAAKSILEAIATDVPYIPLFNKESVTVTSEGFRYDPAGADYGDYSTGAWIDHIEPVS